MRILPVALALLLAAGCLSAPPASPGTLPPAPVAASPTSVLAGTVEPGELTAPTFKLLGALATGGPAYSAGEPSIRATLDGLLYVAFPGCDTPGSILLPDVPGQPRCDHGVVYKSADQGGAWTRLNDATTGRLSDKGPAANGDAEVAVDSAGTVYASNLGGGIHVQKSSDGGKTWSYVANVVPPKESADRQWMAAAHPGHLILAWMGSLGADRPRSVILNTTFDGGATWTGATALGDGIGWIGPVQFAPNGTAAYVVYTQPLPVPAGAQGLVAPQPCSVMVGRTLDGGRAWEAIDTGARIVANVQGQHWSCVNMAPALDVTGDGHVVAAWSEDVESAADLTSQGAVVKAVVGEPGGAAWGQSFAVSADATAIMPWVAAGAGDRFAVTYLASDVPVDPDYGGGRWALKAAVVDGPGPGAKVVRSTIDPNVHEGGICSRGGGCFTSGSDRFLLDFFQNDVLPDGRLVVVYPANPASGARFLEIRVALQDGGSPLLRKP
ncbi:MAG TPA: sialidase family protein [Candidatus Thermoplasmatota archaeon]|nr:sialidase family protein [Candidatus Thermoplasmatota archaeon]